MKNIYVHPDVFEMQTSKVDKFETSARIRPNGKQRKAKNIMVRITKSIEFDLNSTDNEISLPHLMKNGHVRNHVVTLFNMLSDLGYGEFKPGKPGRGAFHRFIKNDKCPSTYTLQIDEKPRGRPRKNANIQAVQVISVPDAIETDDETAVINAINSDNITIEDIAKAVDLISNDDTIDNVNIDDAEAAGKDKPPAQKKKAPKKTKKEKKQQKKAKKTNSVDLAPADDTETETISAQ